MKNSGFGEFNLYKYIKLVSLIFTQLVFSLVGFFYCVEKHLTEMLKYIIIRDKKEKSKDE